jgi:hypothetical protein
VLGRADGVATSSGKQNLSIALANAKQNPSIATPPPRQSDDNCAASGHRPATPSVTISDQAYEIVAEWARGPNRPSATAVCRLMPNQYRTSTGPVANKMTMKLDQLTRTEKKRS